MGAFGEMKIAIQAIAEAIDDPGAYGLREPGGDPIEVERNVKIDPGQSWGETKAFEIFLNGIGEYMDSLGISGVASIKEKLNELITSHNQLLSDYKNAIFPSTASVVDLLP